MADDVVSPLQRIPPSNSNSNVKASSSGIFSPSPIHRPLQRAATLAAEPSHSPRAVRRASILSDFSVEDARQSLRSSTDDLLFPKAQGLREEVSHEASNWQSAPLAFALLPAIGGMLFNNGSAVITDIMLLGLAAIFLNWSVRLPWDWYRSAQSIRIQNIYQDEQFEDDDLQSDEDNDAIASSDPEIQSNNGSPTPKSSAKHRRDSPPLKAASTELLAHEVLALCFCFLGPLLGAYLLHHIRSQLSRPSEGLVSNYNLTIFLMAAEIRPLSHLVKMTQARTLYLQRIVNANPYQDGRIEDKIEGLSKRLGNLESQAVVDKGPGQALGGDTGVKTAATMTAEVRRSVQPDFDALNRAVRRYEKRATLQTMQNESRLQDLEQRLADALSLAAAAAQSGQRRGQGTFSMLLGWVGSAVIFPIQAFSSLISFPIRSFGKLFGIGRSKQNFAKGERSGRSALKYGNHGRLGGERIHARGMKR